MPDSVIRDDAIAWVLFYYDYHDGSFSHVCKKGHVALNMFQIIMSKMNNNNNNKHAAGSK